MSKAPPTSIDALRVPEVMTALRLSRSKVYDLIRSRQLESFTIGRSRRIAADSLRTFMSERIEEAA
ncbi:helix-turn-helix domain-containing protein [Streptomyces benahoarensis]|uniref:Helix-turn-helix domain-containing protein n=1 Tax=Streptomyces benahoarensis TaxID=2595054 RepID=A0A553YSY9_9ACTN|nr:helix-turn-helix domain-containing protein [Streptomyces benahoarensis]TSB17751.1 helix-turn-helix domain-containing protein [Streptomyces benahoarensis]TSB32309.1 helix-turn-helix domain-containing protein [Streptomyces benahoarensis]